MEQARGRTGTGNGGKAGRKTVRGKDPEAVAREQFEAWMQRIMERFDRQDRIISVLINKDAAGVKYMDGRKSYYKESDVLEFISRNMEEVVQDGEKVLKMKDEAKRKPDKAKRKGGGKRVAVHR